MANIVILGAAGQIARKLTAALLEETTHDLVLFGRHLTQRLTVNNHERIRLVEGSFGVGEPGTHYSQPSFY